MENLNEKQQKVLDMVSEMTVLELSQLVKAMEEKFGVSAQAAVAVSAAPVAAAAVEEKTSFNVVIDSVGEKKVDVIKAVKDITGLGLADAKAVVDKGDGSIVKEDMPKADAEAAVKKLTEAGAKASLK